MPDTGETTQNGYTIGNDVTADIAVRRAINYAIDRQALVDGLLEGFGTPAFSPVSGLAWEETDAIIDDADMATAERILDEGGWVDTDGDGIVEKDGLRAEFTILYPATDSVRQSLALAAADMIRTIGIQANVDGRSWQDIEELMHSQAVVFGWGSHDPTEIYNLHHSSYAGVGFFNTGYYANSQVDEYLDLAMGASTQEEANAFWQAAQWDGDTGFTTPGDAAWAWLVNLDHTYFVRDCLDIGTPQIEPHGHGWPITANIAAWTSDCS